MRTNPTFRRSDLVIQRLVLSVLVVISLLSLPKRHAQAETKTAQHGDISAELVAAPRIESICSDDTHLKIMRAGQVERDYDLTAVQGFCIATDVTVQPLDRSGQPAIVVNLFSGGAHCCTTSLIYRYDPTSEQYVFTRHEWGNAGYELVDLNNDGLPEFKTVDDRFAYAFASYAGSFYPLQIWRYQNGQVVNVTRQFLPLVRNDTYSLWLSYQEMKQEYGEGRAPLAAYLAGKYMLGEGRDGWKRVETVYQHSDREQFFRDLRTFLLETGYTAIPQR